MHKLFVALFFISIFLGSVFVVQNVGAVSQNVVISQVQVGQSTISRLVELYNNSDEPVDITGWCLFYRSVSYGDAIELVCFDSIDTATHLILAARSYVLVGSDEFGKPADFMMEAGMGYYTDSSGRGGHVYISDKKVGGKIIDKLAWGTATQPEGTSILIDAVGNTDRVIERKHSKIGVNEDVDNYVDTDDNSKDFFNSNLREEYIRGAIDDVIDVCPNRDEIQVLVPAGYFIDSRGDCIADVVEEPCPTVVVAGVCMPPPINLCTNIDGVQGTLLGKYKLVNGKCMLDLLPLKITELLPDAVGSDSGGEFIEIYNLNDAEVDLSLYVLSVGTDIAKTYKFPLGSKIKANSYLAFYNSEISFTLVNTSSMVSIITDDGQLIDQGFAYNSPKEGQSWALIDDVWQYTNQLTPAAANLPMLVEADVLVIESVSILKPCKDGQYRSEETGRCRNIISDVAELTQCAEGQERNPATNRCRSTTAVLSDSDLKPCDPGQERNPDTNRCRNVVSNIPKADYAPEQTSVPTTDYTSWWILGGIGLIAVSYGVWEWRVELSKLFKNTAAFLRRKK